MTKCKCPGRGLSTTALPLLRRPPVALWAPLGPDYWDWPLKALACPRPCGATIPTAHWSPFSSLNTQPQGPSCELGPGHPARWTEGPGPTARPPCQLCGPGLVMCPQLPHMKVGEGAADVIVSCQGKTGKRPCSEDQW